MIAGVLLKPGPVLTIPKTFTMRVTWSSPTVASIVARMQSAVARAAAMPSSTVRSRPTLPRMYLPSPRSGPWPLTKSRFPTLLAPM